MGKGLQWKISTDNMNFVVEAQLGDLKAVNMNRKKRTAKSHAALAVIKLIEGDVTMKAKFIEHLYGDKAQNKAVGQQLNPTTSTNLGDVRNLGHHINPLVDSVESQRIIASNKKFEESQEILNYFNELDEKIAVSNTELKDLKDTFEEIAEL